MIKSLIALTMVCVMLSSADARRYRYVRHHHVSRHLHSPDTDSASIDRTMGKERDRLKRLRPFHDGVGGIVYAGWSGTKVLIATSVAPYSPSDRSCQAEYDEPFTIVWRDRWPAY